MSKRRFFIIGKGSGSIMRHLTVNVGGGHGSLLVNGNVVTLNENNNYEGDFPDGTQIELETVAGTGYNFEGWYNGSEDLWNYDNPTTFTLDADYSLELHFVELFNVVVQTSLDPSYGYITVNGEPGNFSGEVSDGSPLELQGVGDNQTGDGRRVWFRSWTDNNGGHYYDNPITYTIDSDITINCNFDIDHFTEFIVDPTKYSIVRGGKTMTQTFTDAFISGSSEQYECVCETGYQFDGWLVDGVLDSNTNNPRYFSDNGADRTVEPSVSAVVVNRHISITVDDPTHGTLLVDGTAVTLDANNTWEDDIVDGSSVSIEMQMNNMFAFSSWKGNVPDWQSDYGYCYSNPTTIIMNSDYTITTHTITLHTLEVVVDPSKYTLMVYDIPHTSNYTSVNGGGGCDELQIIPETGYQFNSWGSAWNNNTTNPDHWCYYNDAVITPDVTAVTPTQPNDEIWYTSSDSNVVTPNSASFGTGITVTSNTYADGKGIIKLSGNATEIGNKAFKSRTKLATIDIPNGVTSIGESAFKSCSNLTTINIPNGVTSIGVTAFDSCSNLTTINIPNSVTSIGDGAFYNCTGLTNVDIPDSVTSIDTTAFSRCSGLTSITCEATTPPTLGYNALYDTNNCPIYVPSASVTAYQGTSGWSDYSSRIQAIQP